MLKKNLLKIKNPILLLLLLFVFLSGCADATENVENDMIVFTDALNREVCVQKNPKRVAALIGGFADVWMLAGGTVCATSEDAWDDFELPLEDAVNLGGAHSPNLELLVSSNPDFVIASASTSSNVALKDTLENMCINVAYFDVDSFEDYLSMLDICTDITEKKELYKINGTAIKDKIENIKAEFRLSDLNDEQRTVMLLRASSGSVKTKGSKGTVLGEILADLGCINIADNDTSLLENLNVEAVLKENPYRIFVVFMGDDNEKSKNSLDKMIRDNPAWRSISAIKENRIHIMERKLFHIKPNEKWAESYEQVSKILLKK